MSATYRVSHDRSSGYRFTLTGVSEETDVLNRCPTCGHAAEPLEREVDPNYQGPLVPDIVPDRDAQSAARVGVQVLLETAQGRRSLAAAARVAAPTVVRYVKALRPALRAVPGGRIDRWHAAQPHKWTVEANGLVTFGRPRALAARFEPDAAGRWTCVAFRIINGGAAPMAASLRRAA